MLFDDLPAELDEDNRKLILNLLSRLDVQLFVTSVQKEQIPTSGWRSSAVFHVEQGCVTQLQDE